MLVVRTVGIHSKLQGRSASQVLLLIFFFTPLEGNKQHILLSSSALICCKPSVKPGHDWPNCFLFLSLRLNCSDDLCVLFILRILFLIF